MQIPSATYNLQARGRNFEGDGRAKGTGEEAIRPRKISFNMQEKEGWKKEEGGVAFVLHFTFRPKFLLSRN